MDKLPYKIVIGENSGKAEKAEKAEKDEISMINVRKHELNKYGYKDLIDWLSNKDHIYIGRDITHYVPGSIGSVWQNPYVVRKSESDKNKYSLDDSLALFKRHIESSPHLIEKLKELKGKTLG